MTRQLALRTVLVAAAFVFATLVSWWAVPLAAAAFGAMTRRDRGGPVVTGVAAILAWAALLVWDAWQGPVGVMASTLGGVLRMRPVGVYGLTLAFPGLLAVCAAIVARAVADMLAQRPSPPAEVPAHTPATGAGLPSSSGDSA
ncbi:MAG: hypothetical protein IT356_04460 [Gemmatimonadaceae bacterium]|nr:hypothetical protein [Gemmatimonadaceae bacterium]